MIRTARRGWGLAAAERFERGAYVCQYVGEVITKQEVERREPAYQAAGHASYIFNLSGVSSAQLGAGSALVIDSTHAGNVASARAKLGRPEERQAERAGAADASTLPPSSRRKVKHCSSTLSSEQYQLPVQC